MAAAGGVSVDAFRRAERHSRLVRRLRIATPLLAAALIVAAGVAAVLEPLSDEVHVDVAGIDVGGSTVAMDAPRLRGFNGQDRAYDVTARTARQTLANPNRIELDGLGARIEMTEGGWATLSSALGIYDATAQVLDLTEKVRAISDKGDDATFTSARAELKTGRIVSDRPVSITLGGSLLTADRMEILNSGDRMLFSGRVKLILRRAADAPDVPSPAAPQSP
jgi:lipopolysaccharide export system protein LptC